MAEEQVCPYDGGIKRTEKIVDDTNYNDCIGCSHSTSWCDPKNGKGVSMESRYPGIRKKMEVGAVKFFNEKKGYGFILTEGKDAFFHIKQYRDIDQGDEYPKFCSERSKPTVNPKKGDVLVFDASIFDNEVYSWGFERDYQHAKDEILSRPTYRITEQYSVPGRQICTPTIVWEGSNLLELSRKRLSLKSFSCSDFDVVYRFYRLENRDWIGCDNPLK